MISIIQTEIPRRSVSCQACLAAYSQGDTYYSILENGLRNDFCLSCWKKQAPSGNCVWKATVPFKKEVALPSENKLANAIKLLKTTLTECPYEGLLLALYFARKRHIIFRKDFTENAQTFSLYEVAATEEIIQVEKVSLASIQIDTFKRSIAAKLKEL